MSAWVVLLHLLLLHDWRFILKVFSTYYRQTKKQKALKCPLCCLFQDGLVGLFCHQSTTSELPGPEVCFPFQ